MTMEYSPFPMWVQRIIWSRYESRNNDVEKFLASSHFFREKKLSHKDKYYSSTDLEVRTQDILDKTRTISYI